MSERERLLAALGGRSPVPPPVAPLYLGLYLEPHRRKTLAHVYAEMAEGDSHLRLTFEEEVEARLEALARALALFAAPPAWLPIGLGPSRTAVHGAKVTFPPGQCLWHPPGGIAPIDFLAFYDNRHGDVWETEDEPPADASPVAASCEDLLASGATEFTRGAVQRFGDRSVLAGSMGTPYWACYARLGFSGMMRALRERPARIDEITAAQLAPALAVARALWEAGIRCMFVEECLSSADLISEADYLRFVYPSTHELVAALSEIGFAVVFYFCGAVEARLPHLAGLPADALAFEESKKGFTIDLARVRAEVGADRLLFGNTDAVLLRDGTAEQLAADVARQYAAAGPRFVVSTGSPPTLDTAPGQLDALTQAAARIANS